MPKSSTRYDVRSPGFLRGTWSAVEELLVGTTTVCLLMLNPLALSGLSESSLEGARGPPSSAFEALPGTYPR
eukprot:7834009-Pyramimonas_sp.AAC.1